MLELKIARRIEELEPYKDDWNALVINACQKVPELSHAWISSYLECSLGTGESWVCLLALRDNKLAGVFPIVFHGDSSHLESIGILRAPNDLQTQSVDILVEPGHEKEVILFILDSLGGVFPGWKELKITRISEYSPLLKFVKKGARQHIFLEDLNGWGGQLLLKGSYDNLISKLGRRFRRNIRSAHRKLLKISGFRVYRIKAEDADQGYFDAFIELEGRGWKGRNGTAIRDSETNLLFYRKLAERLSKCGFMEWHFMEARGRIIAGALAVRLGHITHIPKIAYDEEYALYSPGHLLVREAIEKAFGEGSPKEINFMTNAAWLQSWEVERRNYYDLWIYPKNIGAMIFRAAPFRAKEYLRRVPGLKPAVKVLRSLVSK